jgi:subtilisin family serine protease
MTVIARRSRSLFVAIAMLATLNPLPAAAGQPGQPTVPAAQSQVRTHPARPADRIIVKYRSTVSQTTRGRSRAAARVELSRRMRSIDAEVVHPRGGNLAQALAALRADPAVERAEPDRYLALDAEPTAEPFYPYQWGLENTGAYTFGGVESVRDVDIDASGAWPLATGAGVTVAVLDDGVDFLDPELAGQEWTNSGESGPASGGGDKESNGLDDDGNGFVDDVHGTNFCGDASDQTLHVPFNEHNPITPADDTGDFHGTAVAGVIAAAANDDEGVGVAPDADIMAVRWLEAGAWEDECALTDLAIEAIHYAVDNGADVINASWGGAGDDPLLEDAIQYAADHDVVFVAAAGNEGTNTPHYPAAYDLPNLISVGAIQSDGELADFSNYGSWVDMAAPGHVIVAPVADLAQGPDDIYAWSGTSFSAPMVSGVAALIGQLHPELLADPAALKSRILRSGWRDSKTTDLTSTGRVLDARYALDFDPPTPPAYLTGAALTGQTLPASTVTMRLRWPAATDALGIDGYRVRYRKTGSTAWTTIVSSTTNTYVDKGLTVGTRFDIEVSARDHGGNSVVRATTLKPSRYQETTSLASYHGTWKTSSSSSYSGGTTRYSTNAGAYVTFGINAKSLALVMPKGPTRGYFKLYLDGHYVKSISLYSATSRSRQVVFARNWSSVTFHTMRIVVAGTSGHPRVDVDAVIAGQ